MKEYLKLSSAVFIGVILAVVLLVGIMSLKNQPLGFSPGWEGAYSSGATNSSTTVNMTATQILSSDSERQYAGICLKTGGTVWIYKIATSTGVIAGQGWPLFATSTGLSCVEYKLDDPYTGEVWGIGDTTSTVSTQYK